MFYDAWGFLLERADEVLRTQVREHVSDPAALTQLDTVATLLGDLAAMWPRLFSGLEQETQILRRALDGDASQPPASEPPASPRPAPVADPLESHRDVLHAIDQRIGHIHRMRAEDRTVALANMRAAILAASEIQGEILEVAAARAAESRVRRI